MKYLMIWMATLAALVFGHHCFHAELECEVSVNEDEAPPFGGSEA